MSDEFMTDLVMEFDLCSALDEYEAPKQIIGLIRQVGGEFLHLSRQYVDSEPLQFTNSDSVVLMAIEHPLLFRETITNPERAWGSASLSFAREGISTRLVQDVSYHDESRIDLAASGQLAFARLLYPYLRPKYGWIDEMGINTPGITATVASRIRVLFWANFFGPDYVEHYGRQFLLDAPGWKVEELDDGGILYVISASYLDREREASTLGVERYFRKRVPRIRLYQAKPFP